MKKTIFLTIISLCLYSCDNFLEVGPNTSELDAELVFENDNTAIASLEALYHEMQFSSFASGNTSSVGYLGNTLADDAIEYNINNDRYDFYNNSVRADNNANMGIWSSAYKILYECNALLEGVMDNYELSKEVIEQIESEAKFIRAFAYYYLVHLYNDIPLVLSTDYSVNQSLPRNTVEEVYVQIQKDLNDALQYLPKDYKYSNGEHIRPTTFAAYTLLARVALWQQNYDEAIDYTEKVIISEQYDLATLDEAFKANSEEAIWQLIPVEPNTGTNEGAVYILHNNPGITNNNSSQALTDNMLSIWDNDDLRYSHWINIYAEGSDHYYYPFKYKIKNGGDTEEYSMVMRLAELYLIRAEAYAMMGNIDQALTDLNVIRNRAGLSNWEISDVTDIKQMVLEERRRELFSEWGHRWLDLKRFGKIDEVLGGKKPKWSPDAKLLPIPEEDLLRNPFLTQNPGY